MSATAVTQPTFFDSDGIIQDARRRFPFSAKHNLIFGNGKFPASLRCRTPWIIQLWNSADERDEALRKPCGSRCTLKHQAEQSL
jgi:hypothetical protein